MPAEKTLLLGRLGGVLALACLLAAGCAPGGPPVPAAKGPAEKPAAEAPKPAPSRTLTVAYTTDLEGINPYAHSTSTVYARWMHVAEALVWRDQTKGGWGPHLAERWENPDPNTWLFYLRKGVKFHDGSELTADDVVFSYTRLKEDKESKQLSVLLDVEKIEATDRYTVRIRTKNPDAAFVSRLDNRVIVSKAYHDRLGTEAADKQQIGTGPYKFKEWVQGQRLVLIKNEDYWGPFKPAWDEVVFRVIPEAEARITALLNGEVDVIANVPPQQVERVNASGRANAVGTRGDRLLFLALNPIVEPLKNEQVRQAIAQAIDKDTLIKGVLQDRAYRLDGPLGPGMYSYDPNLAPRYNYDPDKAKQMLTQAGYPNGFEVDFYTPVDRYTKDKDISSAIVGMLGRIGIRASLKTPEWAVFSDEYQKGLYPTYLIGRGSVADPSEYLRQYFRTGVTKRLLFSDPEVERALDVQATEFDPAKRVELLRKAQSLIMQKAPAVFLLQYEDTYGVGSRVSFDPRSDEYIFAWDVKPK